MVYQGILSITLPLTNPVLIFSVILFIILFAPLLLHRVRIPDIVGLIIAGALIGPYGLHVMDRNSRIVLFGTVGLLYIMFVAGLEIDMADFRKNGKKSLLFGLYTFFIPMLLGNIARNLGSKIVFYADSAALNVLREVHVKHPIDAGFNEFGTWDDFLILSRDVKDNDALMIVMSRKNYPSYLKNMAMNPAYLNNYFCKNNCILVYPMQIGIGDQELGALKSIPHADLHDGLDELAGVLRNLFKRNK